MAQQSKIVRYKPFPKHENTPGVNGGGGRHYHSASLPLPNVVRIEILSPLAKARYLGQFHSMMEGFRQELANSIMTPDATQPFYGFVDPETNGDLGFDVAANWEQDKGSTLDGIAKGLQKVPVVGKVAGTVAGAISGVSKMANSFVGMMGLDNSSTGSCTMKKFSKADFQFNKSVKCSWYMPEQEAQARVSITRLLKMAYVRNFDLNSRKDYTKKIAEAFRAMTKQIESFAEPGQEQGMASNALSGVAHMGAGLMDTIGESFGLSMDKLVNGAVDLNAFFGGSLTIAPMPVRLTIGHILDIEPLVITNVKVTASKEQFMTDDGTNIPLFVNADISFGMWMIPDPNKGFIRWLGDDVFNIGYTNATSGKTKKDSTLPELTPAPDSSKGRKKEPKKGPPPGRKKLKEPGPPPGRKKLSEPAPKTQSGNGSK